MSDFDTEIGRLHRRYFHGLDERDFDAVADCFAPNAEATYLGGEWVLRGREAIVNQIRAVEQFDATTHAPATWNVTKSDTILTGTLHAVVHIRTSLNVPSPRLLIRGLKYTDQFEIYEGSWRITTRKQDVLWQGETSAVPPAVYLGAPQTS